MIQPLPDFASQYAEWLTSRLSTSIHEGVTELSTPFLDPLNDGMRVYVQPTPDGFLLHDGGLTMETLSLLGIDVRPSSRRASLVETALRASGLSIEEDRIQTPANDGNLPQRMHFLLTAMNRISDLWLTVRSSSGSDFFERVCAYLDEKDVLYSANVVIPGMTVEHPVDILIPLPKRRERLVKLIGTPSVNTAKVVSFSWIEIREVRPSAERVIVLNDESVIEGQEVRRVSEQTEAILRGYSTAVYRWSERNEPSFDGLWRAA